MKSLDIVPSTAKPGLPAIMRQNKPLTFLVAATACLTLFIGFKVILPAYKAPTNRTYTSEFGYAALKHRLKIPFQVQTAIAEKRTLHRRLLGEGFLSTRSLLVPVIPTDKIVSVNVTEGQYVHKGDVLAELDSSKQEIKVHSAELALATAIAEQQRVEAGSANGLAQERPEQDQIDLAAAKKGMDVLKEELTMYQKLEAAGAVAHIQVLDMEKAVASGEADLNRGQFDLGMASKGQPESKLIAENAVDDCKNLLKQRQLELADYKICAPADGIVERVLINAGEYNQDTGKPAFVVASGLWFEAHFDQTSIGLIKSGAGAEVFLEAVPGIRIAGKVNQVIPVVSYNMGPELTPPTRPMTGGALEWPATYKLNIDLDPKGMQLVPGLTGFARVNINHDALSVPRSSILSMSAGSGIVHVINGGKHEARAITYGMTDGKWTEVTSGLAQGDKVISGGQLGLEADDRIQEVNPIASDNGQ
jgi:multidrug resistance efflux pump